MRQTIRTAFAVFSLCALLSADNAAVPGNDQLYAGWMKMYNLKFGEAHILFEGWEKAHPANPMGPVSHAAGYLFSEFARLGVLEAELFVGEGHFRGRQKLTPDSSLKGRFMESVGKVDQLADAALAANPKDVDALLAKSLALGLRGDYFAMIEGQSLGPLKFAKESRIVAERLRAADPSNYDSYLGPGFENYVLSQKAAIVRTVLSWTGSKTDRDAGVEQLRLCAEHGRYLEPFAKLLLAVASLRDKQPEPAKAILRELNQRFPENPLYLKELRNIESGKVR